MCCRSPDHILLPEQRARGPEREQRYRRLVLCFPFKTRSEGGCEVLCVCVHSWGTKGVFLLDHHPLFIITSLFFGMWSGSQPLGGGCRTRVGSELTKGSPPGELAASSQHRFPSFLCSPSPTPDPDKLEEKQKRWVFCSRRLFWSRSASLSWQARPLAAWSPRVGTGQGTWRGFSPPSVSGWTPVLTSLEPQ